jgi:outer membrane immunogenic protein
MNRLLARACVIVCALFAVGLANAADFKGLYAGLNIGGASGSSNAQTSTVFSPTGYFATNSVPAIATAGAQNLGSNGFSGGGQVGYNFEHRHFVFGLETDIGGLKLTKSQSTTATYPCCAPTAFTVKQSLNTSWMYTFRPRAGFTHGPLFIYGTGGLAITNANYQTVFTDTFATAHESAGVNQAQKGWIAGGGAEFKLHHGWSMKGEFLHAGFGSETATSTNLTAVSTPPAFPTNVFTHTANLTANVYRFGLNYHF